MPWLTRESVSVEIAQKVVEVRAKTAGRRVSAEDNYQFDEDAHTLTGRRTKKIFALNGRLDVVVEKVDRFQRLIDFRPAQ